MQHSEGAFVHRLRLRPVICRQALPCYYPAFAGLLINLFKDWSLTSLKEKLIKIGAKVVNHGRYVAFQMAEVAIPRNLFADILRLIAELRPPPVTSTA
jgi:hypothetical protein